MLMSVEEVILQGPKQGCIRYGSWRKLQEGKNFHDHLLRSLIWFKGCVCPLWLKSRHEVQNAMSALPPIATGKADIRKRSCPLYPRKRTCAVHQAMSALGQ